MFIPEGYTEQTVLEALDHVLDQLCKSFCFGYYDNDDMRQEGYISGIEVLPRYNSELSSLETFLRNHIRNRFINLRRNKLERKTPPCETCKYYDANNDEQQCSKYIDISSCNRWSSWLSRNQAKKNLVETSSYVNEEDVDTTAECLDQMIKQETLSIIDKYMPLSLRGDYMRLLDGAPVPKARRYRIYETAKEILRIHTNEEV